MSLGKLRPVNPAVIAVAILTLAGCQQQTPIPEARNSQAKRVPVKTVSVAEEIVQKTTVQPATVHAYYEVEIRPKVTGYVSAVNCDIGEVVAKGAILAIVDVPELEKQNEIIQARIVRFQSAEVQAQAGIELAAADVVSADARLAQSQSELRRVAASLAAAESEFSRTQDLVNRQSVESRLLDEARKRRDSELASREATQSAITSAEAEVTVAKAKRTAAEADLATAKADTTIAQRELEEAEVLLGYVTLRAPFDGIVTKRTVDPGQLVREADSGQLQGPLFVISQIEKVRVHVAVPESDAASVRQGDSISISFPFHPGEEPVQGSVTRISSSLDPSTRTMLVEAEIQNPERKLLPGMFGQATIQSAAKAVAQTLPARAIRFDEAGQAFVYVVDEADTVAVVNVTTGLDDGIRIEIVDGLQTNQRVIDAHLRRFTDGEQVTVLQN